MEMKNQDSYWYDLICQCRQSGLTDKQWCLDHNIRPSTFYRHVRRLRDQSCEIPAGRYCPELAVRQEVVPVHIIDESPEETSFQSLPDEPSVLTALTQSKPASPKICRHSNSFKPVLRIDSSAGITAELTNDAAPVLISSVMKALQTLC